MARRGGRRKAGGGPPSVAPPPGPPPGAARIGGVGCLVAVLLVLLGVSVGLNVYLLQQLRLQPVPAGSVKVVPVLDDDYLEAVLPVIKGAKRSIHVIMFSARFYERYPGSPTNRLLRALADAASRGLDVRVVLEHSRGWNEENARENRETGEWLEERGVDVRYDPPGRTTHDKLIIVDGRWVVVGSTNWSYHALTKNHEASVLIESPEVAARFETYFEQVWREATDTPR